MRCFPCCPFFEAKPPAIDNSKSLNSNTSSVLKACRDTSSRNLALLIDNDHSTCELKREESIKMAKSGSTPKAKVSGLVKKASMTSEELDEAAFPPVYVTTGEEADIACRNYVETWVSPPQWIGSGGAVSLQNLDCSGYVNKFAYHTHAKIPNDKMVAFNQSWRRMASTMFQQSEGTSEWEEWLETGLSHGRPLRLQLMCLPPNTWFRVHSHPTLEVMHCIGGSLSEVRLMNYLAEVSDSEMNAPPQGPDLKTLHNKQMELGHTFEWKQQTMPKGSYLVNRIGSVHQSFTGADGATLFLLWGGVHANCEPSSCSGLCDMLHPTAGHTDH